MNTEPSSGQKEPPCGTGAILEEYRLIRAEIDSYYKSRSPILAIVMSATAVILGFGSSNNVVAVILAFFAVLISGAVLTWSAIYQAQRRNAYLKVFVEPDVPGLRWYRAIAIEVRKAPIMDKVLDRLQLPAHKVLHEYPFVYILLGVVATLYSLILSYNSCPVTGYLMTVTGAGILAYNILLIQDANSQGRYTCLVEQWESVKNQLTKQEDM